MPLVDANDPQVWAGWYRVPMPDGTLAGFERRARDQIVGRDAVNLAAALNLQPGQKIVLLGAGYGWIAEDFAAQGLGPIAAVDTSSYIAAGKAQHATVTILADDVRTTNGRRNIRTFLGGANTTVDWLITEDMLPLYSDAEIAQYAPVLRNFATRVAHWVTPSAVAPMNSKTIAEWKALLAPDLIVARGTAEAV